MKKIYTIKRCLSENIDTDNLITITGWIKNKRDSKIGISFIDVYDGSCISTIQVISSKDLYNYKEILKLTVGCSIEVTGFIIKSKGKNQNLEIKSTIINIIGKIHNPRQYPIQSKKHTLEFLRTVPHLRPRTNIIGAITRIRHEISISIHKFFGDLGYIWIHTPIITYNDCEGSSKMFKVSTMDFNNIPKTKNGLVNFYKDFFKRESFLTVSGQLNAEAYCLSFSKVYTFGPTFRAENSNTSRHLSEFWMVEPELAFSSLYDICELSQNMLHFICKHLLNKSQEDIEFLDNVFHLQCIKRINYIINSNFYIVSYTDAILNLINSNHKFEYPIKWGLDLQSEHERFLVEDIYKQPIIIINYPKNIKGFYMRLNDDKKTVAAMDVLVPEIGEIIGGSQREERFDILYQRMKECKIDTKNYEWYLDLRKYGTVPHSGFGLGIDRLVSYITGIKNIRDVIPFPRAPGNTNF